MLTGQFSAALECADQALAAIPGLLIAEMNRAHALMFLGRPDEARSVFTTHLDEPMQDGKSWAAQIREDFAELRRAKLQNALMDEIEAAFAAKGH